MKYLLLFTCLFFISSAWAQKINKDYLFYPQNGGNLYFILPQKGFKSIDKTDKNGLVYDITYLTSNDSLTFSFTYVNEEICKPEKITILTANNKLLYQGEAQMLFVQPRKKDWEHRGSFKVPFDKAVEFYVEEEPYQLQIHTNRKDILFQIVANKWKKQRYLINRIFEVMKNNN